MTFLNDLKDAATWLQARRANPMLRAASAGLASRMREAGARTLGLLPADAEVAVPAVAVVVAAALAERCGTAVGVVDPHGTWTPSRPAAPADAPGLARTWLDERVAILTLPAGSACSALDALRSACDPQLDLAHVVADLSGFEQDGEQYDASEVVDGVALVARSGATSGRVVARWSEELTSVLCDVQFLGAVVTGL
jgi:hypothetical protein